MKKSILLFLLLPFTGIAQSYFQQEVHYTINVKLDDVKNEITGDESIEYINNSPNQLSFIYMHLWPNAYKDHTTSLAKEFLKNQEEKFYFSKEKERGYIDQLDFKIDGQPAKYELLKDSIDICKLFLNQPLKSGEKITISTPFHVKIPSGEFSRLGHIGQSYQITQWYPKPAVYDRNGWNYMPYLNQGEFYSEFGTFDVSITLPKNYVLGATGDMVDGEKELEWLNQKVKETEAITSFDSKDLAFPASDSETKTLRFKQSNVHDFAWFCDKRYHVLKGEIETPHTKRKVTTWTMFTNAEGNLWKKSIQYMNDAIYYYSLWNGDYPYNHCTAVDGTISAGGGMEYPNITVIGSSGNAFQLDVVITHEVGHNWFYGMLGSNERAHPWMDEGINSFNELRYIQTKYPERKLIGGNADNAVGKIFDMSRYKHKSQYELSYLISAVKNQDQPIELPAYDYTGINYGGIVYSKTAIVFDYLMASIGEKEMDKAMQRYFDEWHFKHPQPTDLRKVLEQSTGKDLGWFFDELINSTKKLDYKIADCNKKADGTWDIEVKNTGDIKGPVFVQGIKDKKVVGEITSDGFDGKKTLNFPAQDVDHFKIDFVEDMPEINRNNNTIRTKGVLKKVEPLKFQFLASLDNPDKTQLYFTPVAGWNNYNKWMFGFAFYNNITPQKKFEFELMPMLSYSTKDFAGYGRVAVNTFPNSSLFQRITFGATTTRYSYINHPTDLNFNKVAPELTIEFKKKYARSPYKQTLRYRNISIFKDYYKGNYEVTPPTYSRDPIYLNFHDLSYRLSKSDAIQPLNILVNIQGGGERVFESKTIIEKMIKISLTANYSYNFKKKNKGVDVRFFAGTFIETTENGADPYRFRLSGQRGYQDYLYDNIFLGRSETTGILANQFTETDGGFKYYSTIGQSSKWLTSLNIKSSIGNLKLPLKIYADIGTTADSGLNNEQVLYNAGVCISLMKDVFEIYLPILMSKDFKDYEKANNLEYLETIRFTLNLNLLNPFDMVRSF
ncbi:MAG: M1 family metallopeptidase [Bacteroidia bacterium]|nr:M1 family metallopeptidase [Bacteroidia bacterium]